MTARVAVLLLAGLATASAQQTQGLLGSEKWTGSADIRNRFVTNVGGSSQVYRSVVNLGEGPRLFDGDLRFADPNARFADKLNLTMSSWGGDPYNTARLSMSKTKLYDLDLNYTNVAYFNNLPSFANPLLAEGSLTSQRALDITRRQLDLELRFLPSSRVTPYVGFYRADGFGQGLTTYVAGRIENEFPVNTKLDDELTSAHAGVNLSGSKWNVTLEQGRTGFSDSQRLYWDEGANQGNRQGPLLGEEIVLNRLMQQYRADGSGLFSRAVLQAQPLGWLQFTGQFLYSQPKIDVSQQLEGQGAFLDTLTLSPYSTIFEQNLADANRPHSSGSWSTEIRPFERLRIVQSYYTDRLHVSSGSTLMQTLNASPELDLEDVRINTLVFNYNQNQVDAIFDAARWLTIRGGHRYVWGDAEVPPPTLQFRPELKTTGEVRRQVGLAGAAMRFWQGKLRVTADFEGSPGNETFFRTGLQNYRKVKARARYQLASDVQVSAAFAVLDNRNDESDIDLDFNSRQTSVSIQWSPNGGRRLTFLGDYTRSSLRSDISIVQPPFFTSAFSRYRDNGHYGSAFADLVLPRDSRLRLGGAFAVNSGSRPTSYYTPQVELTAPLRRGIRFVAEWRWYGFDEQYFQVENFRTHSFSTGLQFGL